VSEKHTHAIVKYWKFIVFTGIRKKILDVEIDFINNVASR